MVTLVSEVHFWTSKDNVLISETDIGAYRYHEKDVTPEKLYAEGKKAFAEERGVMWTLKNKRPDKLKDSLKELEEIMQNHKVTSCVWKSESQVQLILGSGLIVNVTLNTLTGDLERIVFDKYLINKLPSENMVDALFTDTHVICSYYDNRVSCFHFTKVPQDDRASRFNKLSVLDPKAQVLELSGPARRKVERRLSVNKNGDMILVWWKCTGDEVYPWSPLVKDQDRANVLVYGISGSAPEMLCYYRTEFDPVCVTFSKVKSCVIQTVEQKVSRKGEVTIDSCTYEITTTSLQRTSVTSIPLQTEVCCYGFSPKEDKLLFGCIDSSLVLYDEGRSMTHFTKAAFIPSAITWHPDGAVFIIANERGQIQSFDLALTCIKLQLVAEDPNPCRVLDLASYFRQQTALQFAMWNDHKQTSHVRTHSVTDDFMLLVFDKGPLVAMRFNVGVFGGGHLTPVDLTSQYIKYKQVDEAISLLTHQSWDHQGHSCMMCLVLIANHLLRQPLTVAREAQLEAALGSYHAPLKPVCPTTEVEFGSQVRDLTKRFFQLLLRYERFDRAFRLALELQDPFSFITLSQRAATKGEATLAAAAKQKAEELYGGTSTSDSEGCDSDTSSTTSSSCECSHSCSNSHCSHHNSGSGSDDGSSLEEEARGGQRVAAPLSDINEEYVDSDHAPLLGKESDQQRTSNFMSEPLEIGAWEEGWEEEEEGQPVRVVHFGIV